MEITDLAYAAGLVDGEGTVTLTKESKFRYPVVSVSSTTKHLLDFMQQKFGGSISIHKTYQEHHKQSWSWKVTHEAAINLLQQLITFMKEPDKIRRTNLILSQYRQVTKRNGKYSESELLNKLAFEAEFFHPSMVL